MPVTSQAAHLTSAAPGTCSITGAAVHHAHASDLMSHPPFRHGSGTFSSSMPDLEKHPCSNFKHYTW